mmetsp:Transcript_27777/g.65952  ORF Transcript_27777/g.65952 Transcript_27777/m.65952 type:complete len:257 (-) Transcript_27777:158-928(-)
MGRSRADSSIIRHGHETGGRFAGARRPVSAMERKVALAADLAPSAVGRGAHRIALLPLPGRAGTSTTKVGRGEAREFGVGVEIDMKRSGASRASGPRGTALRWGEARRGTSCLKVRTTVSISPRVQLAGDCETSADLLAVDEHSHAALVPRSRRTESDMDKHIVQPTVFREVLSHHNRRLGTRSEDVSCRQHLWVVFCADLDLKPGLVAEGPDSCPGARVASVFEQGSRRRIFRESNVLHEEYDVPGPAGPILCGS